LENTYNEFLALSWPMHNLHGAAKAVVAMARYDVTEITISTSPSAHRHQHIAISTSPSAHRHQHIAISTYSLSP
jgi:hypothetical protein